MITLALRISIIRPDNDSATSGTHISDNLHIPSGMFNDL